MRLTPLFGKVPAHTIYRSICLKETYRLMYNTPGKNCVLLVQKTWKLPLDWVDWSDGMDSPTASLWIFSRFWDSEHRIKKSKPRNIGTLSIRWPEVNGKQWPRPIKNMTFTQSRFDGLLLNVISFHSGGRNFKWFDQWSNCEKLSVCLEMRLEVVCFPNISFVIRCGRGQTSRPFFLFFLQFD